MRKYISAICLALLITVIFGTNSGAAANKPTHHIGLHDRLLTFEKGDARVIDNNIMVPLSDIAAVLYFTVEEQEGRTFFKKYGMEIAYDQASGASYKDGVKLGWNLLTEVDGTLYIGVKYLATKLGFQVDYFQQLQTLRIYRDTYKSMSHAEFEIFAQKQLGKAAPSKAEVPVKPKKANVYLTFDDGPTAATTVNAATLKKYGVHGTFFFVGFQMKAFPEIVKATQQGGHYIGTHSMTHDQRKVYKSTQSFIDEMDDSKKMLTQLTGQKTQLLRVPYGSKPHVTTAMKNQLKKRDYKIWDWDVDTNDWRYTTPQYAEIVKNVRVGVDKSYKSGDRDIVVLLHDRQQTNKALPHIIEWLQKEGYTIKKYDPAYHIVQNFHHDPVL